MRLRIERKLVCLCMILCFFVLAGCGSKVNTVVEGASNKGIQDKVHATITEKPKNKETKVEVTKAATVTPTPAISEKWRREPSSCRIEGNAIVFSGEGYLSTSDMMRLVSEAIGELSEEDLSRIDTIIIEEGITRIGAEGFEGVVQIKHVEFPKSVEVISGFAFEGTSWLETKKKENPMVIVNGNLLSATGCTESVEIPSDITYTHKYAFDNTWLEKQREKNELVIVNGVLIDGCNASRDVVIPKGVRHIAAGAFEDCYEITSVSMHQGVETIGEFAFMNCYELGSIEIPDGVKFIGEGAFQGCKNLGSVEIPDSVQFIDRSAFDGCACFIYCNEGSYAEHYVITGEFFNLGLKYK